MLCPYFFAPLRLCEMKKIYDLIALLVAHYEKSKYDNEEIVS